MRFAVGTITGPIRVCVASESIIVARAAAEMQLKFSGGFKILENSFGNGEVAGDMTGTV